VVKTLSFFQTGGEDDPLSARSSSKGPPHTPQSAFFLVIGPSEITLPRECRPLRRNPS